MEGLENGEDLVQVWWMDNMPGEEFLTIFSRYILVCFSPIRDGWEHYSEEPSVDKRFWEPHLDTDYDSEG